MTKGLFWKSTILVCVAAMAFGSGCKKKPAAGTGMEGLNPQVVGQPGNELTPGALGPRFEEGTRVQSGLQNVIFDYDSAQINPSEESKIQAAADFMKKTAAISVVLEGNCDERGTAEYNLALGERRALAVRAFMIRLGVDAARIQTKSYGEERPVNQGHNDAAWRENRRVEFAMYQ